MKNIYGGNGYWYVHNSDGSVKVGPFNTKEEADNYISTYNDLYDAIEKRTKMKGK